jgi:hypothetical protein
MTTDLATYSEALAISAAACAHPDPVRSRVAYQPQLTNFEKLQAYESQSARPGEVRMNNIGVDLPGTRAPRPRRPHPGDVLYWVACLGGVCGLLLCATR